MKVQPIEDLLVTRKTRVSCLRVPMINGIFYKNPKKDLRWIRPYKTTRKK